MPKTTTDDSITLPPIVVNRDNIEATYESALVYLMLSQDKYKAPDVSVFSFMVDGFDELQSYFNLQDLWEVEHLGPFPTLETLCGQYHQGPPFIDRLRWYAEGAQLQPDLWDLYDPGYVENVDGDAKPDYREGEDQDDEMLTPEVQMRDVADEHPLISTGEERLGPNDFQPISRTPAFDEESQSFYDPDTGVVVGNAFSADDPFGVGDNDFESAEDGFDPNVEIGENPTLDPPSWLRPGGLEEDAALNTVYNGDSAQEQADTGDESGPILKTFVCGYKTPLPRPPKPRTKEAWDAYVSELKQRVDTIMDARNEFTGLTVDASNEARGIWRSERDNKLWMD